MTINGNGSNDAITLDYTNGNPLPATLHLNGTFILENLEGIDPLAGTTLDLGRSTLLITYTGSDPIAAIKTYLQAGYNNGGWNGTPTAGSGVITSLAAESNPSHTTAIGFADSSDGTGVDAISNSIILKYTLYGDANLDGQVNSADLQVLLYGLNQPGNTWDQGDFDYDGQVNSADLQALLFTLNTSLGSQTTALAVAAGPVTPIKTGAASDTSSRSILPVIKPATSTAVHVSHPAKPVPRKRR